MAYQGPSGQWFDDNGTPIDAPQAAPPPAGATPGSGGAQGLPNEPANFDWSSIDPNKQMRGFNPDGTPHYVDPMPGYSQQNDPYQGSWQFSGPGGTGKDWTWLPNAPPQQSSNTQAIAPFSGVKYPEFTAPPLPDALKAPFALPTAENLYANDPGIQARYNFGLQGLERGAAAQGSLLNGGQLKATERYGQDYASNEYDNYVKQLLGTRQQQSNDYLNLAYGPAWQTNQSAVGQYNNLYGQYQDLITNNRNASNDYANNLYRIFQTGANTTAAGAPSPGSTGSGL